MCIVVIKSYTRIRSLLIYHQVSLNAVCAIFFSSGSALNKLTKNESSNEVSVKLSQLNFKGYNGSNKCINKLCLSYSLFV